MTKIRGLVGVLGGGESGVGAALLADKNYTEVMVSDYGTIKEKYKNELNSAQVPFEENGHTIEILEKAKVVVKSPGIPESASIVKALRSKGVLIISEIEFGSMFSSGKIIGITGSNGKTTTSGLLHHLLHAGGYDTAIGGNYGKSFCRILTEEDPAIWVLEISSFQLDDIRSFKPDIAMILNLSPDHLDRYDYDYKQYIDAKFRIIENQGKEDVLIYNGDDAEVINALSEREEKQQRIEVLKEDYIKGILSKDKSYEFELTIRGEHNLFNAYCAVRAARLIGLSEREIGKGLETFKNAAHRLEKVAEINQVTYINDSKATNVDATFYGLSSIDRPTIWIAGGVDKGNDYQALLPIMDNVKMLICLGKENEKLKEAFKNKIEIIKETQDVDECILMAQQHAEKGDVVLLSPACASFDLFDNYEHRGDQFRNAVLKLE